VSDGKNNAKKNTTYYTFGANKFVPVSSQPLARKGLPIKTYSRTATDLGQNRTNDTATPNKPDPPRGTGGRKTNAQVSVIKTLPKMKTLPTIITEPTIMTIPATNANKPGSTIMIEPTIMMEPPIMIESTTMIEPTITTIQVNDTILTTFDPIIPVHTSTVPENSLATLNTPPIVAEPLSPASQFQATMDTILDDEVMRTGGSTAEEFVADSMEFDFDWPGLDTLVSESEKEQTSGKDEGYSTGSSASDRSSPTSSVEETEMVVLSMQENNMAVQSLQETNSEISVPIMNVENIMMDAEGIEFTLLDNTNAETDFHPSDVQQPIDAPSGTVVHTFNSVADLLKTFNPDQSKQGKKHKTGPIPQPLEKLPPQNIDNVLRCREYRSNKNKKLAQEMDELEALEEKNRELRKQEKKITEKLAQAQTAYLRLIREGRVKYCV